jgi:hypothetical protein
MAGGGIQMTNVKNYCDTEYIGWGGGGAGYDEDGNVTEVIKEAGDKRE